MIEFMLLYGVILLKYAYIRSVHKLESILVCACMVARLPLAQKLKSMFRKIYFASL